MKKRGRNWCVQPADALCSEPILSMFSAFSRNHKVLTTLGVYGIVGSTLLINENNRLLRDPPL